MLSGEKMLDTLIRENLDKQEILEEEVHKEIDTIVSKIDVEALFDDPLEELSRIAEIARASIVSKLDQAIANGVEFADAVEKDKVEFVETNDPHLNKDEDVKGEDNNKV